MAVFLMASEAYAQVSLQENKILCHDDQSREKYCRSANPDDIEICLSCYVGPSCPVRGKRGPLTSEATEDGILLLRGITDRKVQKLIVAMLNKQRLSQQWSRCVPLFAWDPSLASAAQAWADQCALVEYNTSWPQPQRLYHDSWRQRSSVLDKDQFHDEPGVAQTVHWARTSGLDLNGETLEALMESNVATEDGLIDGMMTNLHFTEENTVVFGEATHVGCGWIQFPSNAASEAKEYENFMVCNYGVGVAAKTSCDEVTGRPQKNSTMIKYFTVTSEVISDVKACLEAVRCRRRRRKFLKTFSTSQDANDPCAQEIRRCLGGRSGLKFLDATKLRSVARSNEYTPLDVEASKCKVDTILCSLNSTVTCEERLEYCLPLIDIEGPVEAKILCQCADLILADGTRGDCTQEIDGRPFCFVKHSPCVSLDPKGHYEFSRPFNATDGLLHYSHFSC